MNKKLKLAFLWHMHQPYYKDDVENTTLMPWVFLHTIKDYYDIPWYASKFSSIKATYNLVPSLISQIQSYIENRANDKLLELILKPVSVLNEEEKQYLQTYLFLSNEKNMIKPLKRYYEIYLKFKAHNCLGCLDEDELLDLEVLFLLSWCGNYLRENDMVVSKLLNQQRYYTQEQKEQLVYSLYQFLPQVLELYKQLEDKGLSQVSTTPYFHPITPLLLDIQSAKDAKVNTNIPNIQSDFSFFGKQNTKMAIEKYNNIFGKNPTGFWPAEGSVSVDTARLFIQNDLKWFCTDQEILFKTLGSSDKKAIYKNYRLELDGKAIDVRFRDHYLSDSIGFRYSKLSSKEAVEDFINNLKQIYDTNDFSPLVTIILDGENAWEFFPNNAQDFFEELYKKIEDTTWIECVTMDDISKDTQIQTKTLTNIASGSWIDGNFDIWIGSEQKNRAWELLDITSKVYEKNKQKLSENIKKLIENEFMIALGSDWFWWYGDDHYTKLASQFDELFRKHLINIFHYMNEAVPSEIYTPIVQGIKKQSFHIKPVDYIYPKIDGKKSNYFEWLNSGQIDTSKEFSVMDSKYGIIQIVRYGYNFDKIYFLFDGEFSSYLENSFLEISLEEYEFKIPLKESKQFFQEFGFETEVFITSKEIEISFDKKAFKQDKIKFAFELKKDEKTIQKFPIYDDFYIDIENLGLKNWYI